MQNLNTSSPSNIYLIIMNKEIHNWMVWMDPQRCDEILTIVSPLKRKS